MHENTQKRSDKFAKVTRRRLRAISFLVLIYFHDITAACNYAADMPSRTPFAPVSRIYIHLSRLNFALFFSTFSLFASTENRFYHTQFMQNAIPRLSVAGFWDDMDKFKEKGVA